MSNQTINWKRQNRIQKYGESIYKYFKPVDVNYPFEVYNPKIKRWRIGIASIVIGGCLITPFTNWMIPFVVRWMVR